MTGQRGDGPQATATAGTAAKTATAATAALLGAALVASLLAAGPTPAQSVRGTVTAADYDRPVTGARVLLVDTLSMAVDSTTADSLGRYHLTAPAPGLYFVVVEPDDHLSYPTTVELGPGETEVAIEMPLLSTAAARTMHEAIQREDAFQLDLDKMCAEPLRPWEAGVLVGVSRHRRTMDPVPRAVVRVELLPSETAGTPWRGRRVATGAGSFWFCNVPPGRARIVARAEGFAPDTSYATIQAGTISWYDALLRPLPAN